MTQCVVRAIIHERKFPVFTAFRVSKQRTCVLKTVEVIDCKLQEHPKMSECDTRPTPEKPPTEETESKATKWQSPLIHLPRRLPRSSTAQAELKQSPIASIDSSADSNSTITLPPGKFYKVSIGMLGGEFFIKSGRAGRFSIDDVEVTIRDLQDDNVFTRGGLKDGWVTLEDDPVDATTKVTYHPPATTEKMRRTSWKSGSMMDVIEAGKVILSPDFDFRIYDGPDFVRIVVRENEHVLLKSKLLTVIAGGGGHIQISDSGNVYANLPMASLSHVGRGLFLFAGNVEGDCTQYGSGEIKITGDISSLIQKGDGTVKLNGNVRGPVHQQGNLCKLEITGNIQGPIRQLGEGNEIINLEN